MTLHIYGNISYDLVAFVLRHCYYCYKSRGGSAGFRREYEAALQASEIVGQQRVVFLLLLVLSYSSGGFFPPLLFCHSVIFLLSLFFSGCPSLAFQSIHQNHHWDQTSNWFEYKTGSVFSFVSVVELENRLHEYEPNLAWLGGGVDVQSYHFRVLLWFEFGCLFLLYY